MSGKSVNRDLAPFTCPRHTRLGLNDKRRHCAKSLIAHGSRARDFCDCNCVNRSVGSRLRRLMDFVGKFSGGCRFRGLRFDVEVRPEIEVRRTVRCFVSFTVCRDCGEPYRKPVQPALSEIQEQILQSIRPCRQKRSNQTTSSRCHQRGSLLDFRCYSSTYLKPKFASRSSERTTLTISM